MTSDLHLTPHFESFVRAQLQTGRFRSREDLISAALALLEEQSASTPTTNAWATAGHSTRPDRAPAAAASHSEGNQSLSQSLPSNLAAAPNIARRSPRGLLADLASHLDHEDFMEARSEAWSRYLDDRAG